MYPRPFLRGSALALGAAVLLGTAAPAPAQFGPRVGFTYQFGLAPAVSYNPYAPFLPQVPGRFSYHGYTLTGVGAAGPYSLSYGYYRNAAVTGFGGYGGTDSTGYGSGVGGNRAAGSQRAAIAQAQNNAKWDTGKGTNPPDFDRWMKEVAVRREAKDEAAEIDSALVHPPEEAVESGDVLNELAVRIRHLEKQGKRAKAGLIAPELTTKIVFAGGPAADAANLFHTTEPPFPPALNGPAHAEVRAELEKAFAAVAKDAQAGKKVAEADADRLLKAVGKARTAIRQWVADAAFADAFEVSEFFTRLEAAGKYLKADGAAGVAGANWSAVGATVAEVAQHQEKFGVAFGPAKGGDEAAYYSLHRGLLAYYAALSQAK